MPTILPYELHSLIIQKARGKGTLRSLALCCSSFRDAAQTLLFKCPFGGLTPSPDQQHCLIHSIVSSPGRLGPMVRIFVYSHGKEDLYVPGGTYDEVATAFRAMRNLKQLVLNEASRYPPSILDGCTFQLEVFHMQAGTNAFLAHFLPTQPYLKHLGIDTDVAFDLDGGSDVNSDEWADVEEDSDDDSAKSEAEPDGPLEVPPSMCPQLQSLYGAGHNVMGFFADGRPIKRLDWNDIALPPAFPPITQFPLEYLKISTTILRWGHISFGATMGSLLTLELVAIEAFINHALLAAFISRMVKLRTLILTTQRGKWNQTTIQSLFSDCQRLERIDIQDSETSSETMFKRFSPKLDGQIEQKLVNLADVYRGVPWIEDKCSYQEYYDMA